MFGSLGQGLQAQQNQQQPQNNSIIGGFGQPAQNQPSGTVFGQSIQNQPTGSIFGQSTQNQSQGGAFGQAAQNTQNQPTGSLFGQSTLNQPSGGLFGQSTVNQQNGSIFGQSLQNQPGGGLFGQSTVNQPNGSIFGQSLQNQSNGGAFGQSTQNQQSGGILGQNTQNQPTGSVFGQSMQNQPTGSVFGQSMQNQQLGIFGRPTNQLSQPQQNGLSIGAFGQPNPMQQSNTSVFAQSQQLQLPQLGKSGIWQPNSSISPREKSIPEQMSAVFEKWDTSNPNCAFKYYFYNTVDDNMAPYYKPGPNEDPKAWDEALSNKPDKGYIPVLCVGFAQMGERIKLQQRNLANFNARLHEINDSLSRMMLEHETRTSIKAMDARRKHAVLKQRCIALAKKVQVLRNRGYALGGDEEDLKIKLTALERKVNDPALGARGEEIWARMLAVQDRARLLQSEIGKSAHEAPDVLGEELTRRAKKILEDYHTQLGHLSNELELIKKDYEAWLKTQGQPIPQDRGGLLR